MKSFTVFEPCKALWRGGSSDGLVCGYRREEFPHEITSLYFNHGYEGDSTMATTTTPVADPTLGVPTVTAKAPRKAKVSAAPTPVPTGRARKARPSGADLKSAVAFARKTTGYDETSPIWKKPQIDVLVDIETLLQEYVDDAGGVGVGSSAVETALRLNRELQKRIATNQLTAAQLR